MTDYAAMVTALYRKLGRWRLVAEVCADRGAQAHSPGYYQQVAVGRIKTPDAATAEAIRLATGVFSSFSATRMRAERKGLTVSPEVFFALEAAKSARGDVTWDTLLDEAAHLLESRSVTPTVTE